MYIPSTDMELGFPLLLLPQQVGECGANFTLQQEQDGTEHWKGLSGAAAIPRISLSQVEQALLCLVHQKPLKSGKLCSKCCFLPLAAGGSGDQLTWRCL